ncbi:MAG: BMC domain-containing protein [Planctomycetota bacterium]
MVAQHFWLLAILPRMTGDSLGILETTGMTPAIAALDAMDKAAAISLLQLEWNDFYGVVIKIQGATAAVAAALEAAERIARQMNGQPLVNLIARPDPRAWSALESPPEYNPLIQSHVVLVPGDRAEPGAGTNSTNSPASANSPASTARSSSTSSPRRSQEVRVAEPINYALGLIETQGFTAVFEAIDSACKAANVEVVCKEKLGGGYVTVVIKGDVAAVHAAVDAGKAKVEGLGKLIAAHVIARPSAAVLSLLPK